MLPSEPTEPHSVSREQEAELTNTLSALGSVFNLYRGQLGEYIASNTKDDWGAQMVSKGLGIDERTNLLTRFSKLFENPATIEHFHRTGVGAFASFLDKDPDFILEDDEMLAEQRSVAASLGFLAGDKIQHMMAKISKHLSRELERLSLVLVRLYEEEELDLIIQEKRIRGLKKFMRQSRYLKMDIQAQIRATEAERKDVLEALTYMTDPNPTGVTSRDTAEDYLGDYLKRYADKKDYVYTLFEDHLLDYITSSIKTFYKEHSLKAFEAYVKTAPYSLYLRDYSFAVDRYFTNFMVKGSSFIASKKGQSHQVDDTLLSQNFLECVCRYSKGNPHKYLKYASNHVFDNLTMSAASMDYLYHSYTCSPPKVLLVLKNLAGAFLDEVDNSDNLVYENPLDVGLSILKSICPQFRDDVASGVFGDLATSIITAEMVQVKRTDYLSSIFVKFDTERRLLDAMHSELRTKLSRVHAVQNKYFKFFDYDDFDKLIVYSDTRFRLKEKSNPNQAYLDEINKLRSKDNLKIKKIPETYLRHSDFKFKGNCPRTVVEHSATSTILEGLLVTNLDLLKERHDVFVSARVAEATAKPGVDTDDTKLRELSESVFSSVFNGTAILSRKSLVQILSCLNFSRSICLAIGRRSEAVCQMQANAESLEHVRLAHLQGLVKRKTERKETSVKDDADLESFRNNKTERRRSVVIEEGDLEFGKPLVEVQPSGSVTNRSKEGSSPIDKEKSTFRPEMISPKEVPMIREFSKVHTRNQKDILHTLRLKLKDQEVFDDWTFETLGSEFLLKENSKGPSDLDHLYIKIVDHLEQEIIYDKALEDFEDLLSEVRKICGFYLQTTVVDFCFDSLISTELVSNDLKEKDSPLSHLRMEATESPQHVNHEYIVYEVLRHESQFQAAKALAIKAHFKLLENAPDIDSFEKAKKAIFDLIAWRPEFDFAGRDLLTETMNEMCNSKSSNSSVSTKDTCKEIQNFLITVFDHYRNATMYLESLNGLIEEIYEEQKRVWLHTEVLADLRKRDQGKLRVRKYINTVDNLAPVTNLHTEISEGVRLLVEELIPIREIDSNTITDFCIEEHRQTYYKTMQVKYTEGATLTNVVGKGVKESTIAYLMRLQLQNRLANRINFIKGNLRLNLVEEIRDAWKKSVNTLSSRLINSKEPTFTTDFAINVEFDPHADDQNEKYMKDLYYGMDGLIKSLDDEKKNHIYAVHAYVNRRGQPAFSKSKAHYTKGDWKSKVFKLNPVFGTYYFLCYQFEVRNRIASLEPYLAGVCHSQNIGLLRSQKIFPSEEYIGRQFEKICNLKELYNMYGSSLQRLLQTRAISKFELEDLQKRVANLGDSKFANEYLTLLIACLEKNVKCFARQWTSLTTQAIVDVSRVMPNSTVANTLITSIGVNLDPNGTVQTPVTEGSQLLITSVENNEIIFGSENESVIRRMILQLLRDNFKEVHFDVLAEVQALKVDIAQRHQGHQTGQKL
jgi:hypothetical protein